MFSPGLRLIRSFALVGAELAVDVGRAVGADELFDIEPRQLRRLLLTFDETIQGRIPEVLGDTEEERVETLVRLLRGTSEEDMIILLGSLQVALQRLERERRREGRGGQELRSDDRRRELRPVRHPVPFLREVTDESRYA